jgi:gamma-glutamylcyclotransferase (GGCT)/AIG2-like uncharacterized protein YtfP
VKTTKWFHVFVYGSLLNEDVMRNRVDVVERVGVVRLNGMRLSFVGRSSWGGGVATIDHASPADHVTGAVWRTDLDGLDALDMYEGVPRLYTRERIDPIKGLGGIAPWFYQHTGAPIAPPSESYFDAIVAGCASWGIDDTHIVLAAEHARITAAKTSRRLTGAMRGTR